jgi:hypothetical protein
LGFVRNLKGRNFNEEVLPFDFLGSYLTLIEGWQGLSSLLPVPNG